MAVLVTGGAGFIGSNFVVDWINQEPESIVNVDKLTYAGHLQNLASVKDHARYHFAKQDICDGDAIRELLRIHKPRAIVHLAAESHVDRSVHGPAAFVDTNIVGTFRLLDAALEYWRQLPATEQDSFRFLHVSTDEVFGSLQATDAAFSETTAYAPNSPYSASKAAADHLVRAYFHTYGLPVLTSNCSNNYGPFQFPEKLIPLMLLNAMGGQALPVYGDGLNSRDWLYVGDHCAALRLILKQGKPGETYNVGGRNELTNLDVVNALCERLDELLPRSNSIPHSSLIKFVEDRPGHDRRYAIDASKIEQELGWRPLETFDSGLKRTVQWYLENSSWLNEVTAGKYADWISTNYAQRAQTQ